MIVLSRLFELTLQQRKEAMKAANALLRKHGYDLTGRKKKEVSGKQRYFERGLITTGSPGLGSRRKTKSLKLGTK